MKDNIVETNKPSSGRIYDYLLGGNHNFEVDRLAGDTVLKAVPFLRKFALLQRWSLLDIAEELTVRRGFDLIIDFASGLPTMDHIHNVVPKGTTVIYSDYDPVVVEYAHEILKGTPDVYFFLADLTRPGELLENPEVLKILAGRRNVGLSFWGVTGFVRDDDLARTMKYLYDWSGPDTVMALNAQAMDLDVSDPAIIRMFEIYESFGQERNYRSSEQYTQLVQPWRLDEKGWISLLKWHGFDQSILGKEDADAFGPLGGGFGAYLTK